MRHESYQKLTKGDLVRIKGERGTFRVMYVDEFDAPRPVEVTVVGGAPGHSAWRTKTINNVKHLPKRRVK